MKHLAAPLNEPPDRLKVGCPGFGRYAGRIAVFLNDIEVTRCVEFDTEKGFVRVQRLDAEGRIHLDRRGKIAQQTRRGRVEVRWK